MEIIVRSFILKKSHDTKDKWQQEFYEEMKDILEHPKVLEMQKYPHHGVTNCYQHCVNVGYANYRWCKFLKLDAKSAARGGILHDLFLYDWHSHAKETGNCFHGLTHPKVAYENAKKYFQLNETEKDVILSHMWPVTFLHFPRTREGFVTTITDKYCGFFETIQRKHDVTRLQKHVILYDK